MTAAQATIMPYGDWPYQAPVYNTWVTPTTRTVKTTTREYDEQGNLVKETVVEETTNQGRGWDQYTQPYRVTY
jgi:uncharacterized protein RhaS with RHS repeats